MLTKTVADTNGVRIVQMSPEEEAEILALWASKKTMPPQVKPVDAIISDPIQVASLKSALGLT